MVDDDQKRRGVDWQDPDVPVGDSPPLPRWPVVAAALAWLLWIGFLCAMVIKQPA